MMRAFKLFQAMKKLFTLLLCLTGYVYSQWTVSYTFTPAQSLQAIRFYDANTGYTVAPVYGGLTYEIHKTTNAGANWVDQNAGYTGTRLMAIWILHPDTVYISGNEGLILKTVNGGTNWVTINSEATLQLWGLQFVNSFTGYVAGSNGRIMKTTNAGANWFNQSSGTPNLLSSIHFRNDNTGYISGGSIIIKTTNAGANWVSLSAPYINLENIRDITFIDDINGIAVSDADRVFKTTNAGANWMIFSTGTGQSLFGVFFTDANTGFTCGFSGAIARTSNAGVNWSVQTSPLNEILTDVWFTSVNTGYISTWSGKVLKTTNGGMVAVTPISSEVPDRFLLYQNYPNPFNPTTKIRFEIPLSRGVDAEGRRSVSAKLIVYDILGREVAKLVNEDLKPGVYEAEFDGSNYSSGVYHYKLTVGIFHETKKMLMIK
ncbi:MAG TPA: YCF48-related protein, partial [Ignavibacteria bacterium]|jgi:photosystem II stability/assembly factor-like uncharacterized protein